MKKLFKVETNASTMFVTYDEEEKIVMCLDNEETNSGMDIREVEDDSSWYRFDDVENFNEWLGKAEIVDEIEF